MKLSLMSTLLVLFLGQVKCIDVAYDELFSVIPEKGFIRARKARVEIADNELRTSDPLKGSALTARQADVSNSVFCHPPIGFSAGYSFAYFLSDVNGQLECVRGISTTSVTQVSMSNSESLTLYLNCPHKVAISDQKLGTVWFVKNWKVLHYSDGSGTHSLVTPCPPCAKYTVKGGNALKDKGEAKTISYESSLATFDTTTSDYSYNEGTCLDDAIL